MPDQPNSTALKYALPVHEIRWRIYWRHELRRVITTTLTEVVDV